MDIHVILLVFIQLLKLTLRIGDQLSQAMAAKTKSKGDLVPFYNTVKLITFPNDLNSLFSFAIVGFPNPFSILDISP